MEATCDTQPRERDSCSVATLKQLMAVQSLHCTTGDPALAHRLDVASQVYSCWTNRGAEPAAAANRYLDGSLTALTEYIQVEPGGHSAEDSADAAACCTSQKSVDMVAAESLSYDDFVTKYMTTNTPVLIKGVTNKWRACQDWVLPDGTPDLQFLGERFGRAEVCVHDAESASGYGGAQQSMMSLQEYIQWWQEAKAGAHEPSKYLKDWHFAADFPEYQAYATPSYASEDWLNGAYDAMWQSAVQAAGGGQPAGVTRSDYRFVYLGPKGTSTAIHADVLRSYSWSTNVCGRKSWRLLPPQHTHLLYDCFAREMASSFDPPDGSAAARFPNLALAASLTLDVDQGAGDMLFVPSGWHHSVCNEADTLSINHNWFNAHNVHWAVELLRSERQEAIAAIEDCRGMTEPAEFEGLVQRNLTASCSFSYPGFAALLHHILKQNLYAALDCLELMQDMVPAADLEQQPDCALFEAQVWCLEGKDKHAKGSNDALRELQDPSLYCKLVGLPQAVRVCGQDIEIVQRLLIVAGAAEVQPQA